MYECGGGGPTLIRIRIRSLICVNSQRALEGHLYLQGAKDADVARYNSNNSNSNRATDGDGGRQGSRTRRTEGERRRKARTQEGSEVSDAVTHRTSLKVMMLPGSPESSNSGRDRASGRRTEEGRKLYANSPPRHRRRRAVRTLNSLGNSKQRSDLPRSPQIEL